MISQSEGHFVGRYIAGRVGRESGTVPEGVDLNSRSQLHWYKWQGIELGN